MSWGVSFDFRQVGLTITSKFYTSWGVIVDILNLGELVQVLSLT